MTALANVEPYASNPLMGANLAFLGYVLIVYALFNTVFLSGFFKTAYKYGRPFIVFCVVSFVVAAVGEVLPHLPGLGALGATTAEPLQGVVLAVGILSFALGTACSLRASMSGLPLKCDRLVFERYLAYLIAVVQELFLVVQE